MKRRALVVLTIVLLGFPVLAVHAETTEPASMRRVAGGLHDGHAFGPRLRPDGKWVAYGVREEVKGTFKTSYYARDLDGGLFRSVWPNAHPSFLPNEGVASFTDMVDFEWSPGGKHNAMVPLHKELNQEVMLETLGVRFTGSGAEGRPTFAPDGNRIVVVADSQGGRGTELWIADVVDGSAPLQLTFTVEAESAPSWHPKESKIIHEFRNPLGSDIYVFDLDAFTDSPLFRMGTSDELEPSYSPDGTKVAFLSNKDSVDGLRFDLFVAPVAGGGLPKAVIRNVRRSDKSRGYCWDPSGNFLIAATEDADKQFPLVIAPADGTTSATALVPTRDNMDPTIVAIGDQVRLAWVALDKPRKDGTTYRVVHVADFNLTELGEVAGTQGAAGPQGANPEPQGTAPDSTAGG